MRFVDFEKVLKTKYHEARACAHGTFGGTERNRKTEITFTPNGKCYEYYGSYSSILNKLGIKVIEKSDIECIKRHIEELKRMRGKEDFFSDEPIDNSEEIAKFENKIREYENTYTII